MSEQKDFADGVDTTYMDKLGAKLYGETWPTVRAHNVKRMKGDDPTPLGPKECQTLVNGLLAQTWRVSAWMRGKS